MILWLLATGRMAARGRRMMATATANGKPMERATRVRVLLIFMLFLLSAVAFLDRTNISVAAV